MSREACACVCVCVLLMQNMIARAAPLSPNPAALSQYFNNLADSAALVEEVRHRQKRHAAHRSRHNHPSHSDINALGSDEDMEVQATLEDPMVSPSRKAAIFFLTEAFRICESHPTLCSGPVSVTSEDDALTMKIATKPEGTSEGPHRMRRSVESTDVLDVEPVEGSEDVSGTSSLSRSRRAAVFFLSAAIKLCQTHRINCGKPITVTSDNDQITVQIAQL